MTDRHRARAPELALAAVLVASVATHPAGAQSAHEHEHEHASATASVAQLQLDEGRKWPTDASLRAGMASIRAAFESHHPAIHAGTQSDDRYEALAATIETQIDSIVANCRLPPAADANLHYVLADLLQGVSLMRGQDPSHSRHDGAARVHGALRAYGKFFDDPATDAASQ